MKDRKESRGRGRKGRKSHSEERNGKTGWVRKELTIGLEKLIDGKENIFENASAIDCCAVLVETHCVDTLCSVGGNTLCEHFV